MIKAWSPSLLESYEACPRRAKLERVDKLCPKCFKGKLKGFELPTCDTCKAVVEPPPPLVRGTLVHAQAEAYITGREKALHPELLKVKAQLNKLRTGYKKRTVRVEVELAVDAEWRPVEWFSKAAWLRAKLDVLQLGVNKLHIVDWKTGRFKPDGSYGDQLSIYSTAALCLFDMMESATASLTFTDCGTTVQKAEGTVTQATLGEAKKKWAKRALPMFKDTTFAPTPSMGCRYCAFSRNKGGPCQF